MFPDSGFDFREANRTGIRPAPVFAPGYAPARGRILPACVERACERAVNNALILVEALPRPDLRALRGEIVTLLFPRMRAIQL